MTTEYLCKCNNCGKIMYDENPDTKQDKIPLSLVNAQIYPMELLSDSEGSFYGCGDCETDAFLMDVELSDFQ
jgi:hypothetical protein